MYNPLNDDNDLRNELLGIDPEAVPLPPSAAPVTPTVEATQGVEGTKASYAEPEAAEASAKLLAAGNQTKTTTASRKATPDLGANPLSDSTEKDRPERVNQALYYAGIGKALPDEYFARPSRDRQSDDKLEMMKQSLLTKYADKEAKAKDAEEANNASSERTKRARALAESTVAGRKLKERMGPLWETITAAQLEPLNKQFLVSDSKSESEDAKTGRAHLQIGGKKDMQAAGFEHQDTLEETKHGYRTEEQAAKDAEAYRRAQLQADKAWNQFNARFGQTQDNEVRQAVSSLPKNAVSSFESFAKIDRLIGKMGGADKIRGLGLGTGAIPNQLVAQDVDDLRRNYQMQKVLFNHDYFGANLTKPEIEQGKKAIAAADGATTVGELLDSMDILRNLSNNSLRQATAGWSDRVYQAVQENLAKDRGDLITPQPQVETRKGGAYTPKAPDSALPDMNTIPPPRQGSTPSKSPGEHPINTTAEVKEPTATPQNTQMPPTMNVSGKVLYLHPNGRYYPNKP